MARLPAYTSRAALDTGGDTSRPVQDTGAALARGLSTFGAGLADLGERLTRFEAAGNAKYAETLRVQAGLEEQREYEAFEARAAQIFEDNKRNADPAGVGFEDGHLSTFDAAAQEYLSGATTSQAREKRQLALARLRTSHIKQAGTYETSLTLRAVSEAQAKTYADAGAIVGQIPDNDGLSQADLMVQQAADRLNLTGRAREAFIRDGRTNNERMLLAGLVARDPERILRLGVDLFSSIDTTPKARTRNDIVVGAQAAGFDPRIMLGIGWIESRWDASVTTGGKSTAAGTFQYLKGSAYGDPTKPYGGIDPSDTKGQAEALGVFLSRIQERYAERGRQLTPGELYMFHNVGEGVASRLISEPDRDKKMSTLLYEVYGDARWGPRSLYPGQLKRDVIARNNPSLYGPNMTVAQVRQRYETKMASALAQTDGATQGQPPTSDILKVRVREATGVDVQGLTFDDINKAVGLAQKQLSERTRKQADDQMYYGYVSGQLRMSPHDPEHKKIVDKGIRENHPEIYEGFVRGDNDAIATARQIVTNLNYVPRPFVEGAREMIHSTGAGVVERAKAYEFMASVSAQNKVAFDAASIDEDTAKRIRMYEANRERLGTKGAVEFVDRYFSPEGQKRRAAVQASLEGRKGELSKLTEADFTAKLSENHWLRGVLSDQNGVGSTTAGERFMLEAKAAYRRWREDGADPETAKTQAINEVGQTWGTSTAFTGTVGRPRIMRHPPDKYYATTTLGMQPFETQAREIVQSDLNRRYPKEAKTKRVQTVPGMIGGARSVVDDSPMHSAESADVRVISTVETEEDIKAGRPPRYQVWYRDPKTGAPTLAYPTPQSAMWAPNINRMQDEDQDAEIEAIEKNRAFWPTKDEFRSIARKKMGLE